ncbi:MAG TPA: hypothetical protein VI703_09700 [Anaerolineales bacterium]|jgi:hypothetical protein|nr:hypothetical protein [Anaerolineales bacterium]
MKNRFLFLVAVLGFLLLLAACSPAPAAEPLDAAEVDEPEEAAAPETGGDVAAGGGLVLPNICELLPVDEVAAIVGGAPASEPNVEDYGASFQGCWYDFNLSDGSYDYYIIYVQPASFLEVVFEDSAEPVSGLGDRAQLKWEDSEEQYRLAIIDGAVGVEVIGTRSDVMMQLARLILERL